MTDNSIFVLTPEQRDAIRRMEADKARLEKIISDSQRELAPLNERLRAVAVLAGPEPSSRAAKANGMSFGMPDTPAVSDNMTEAIEKIANEASAPILRKELKRLLSAQGFPADQLGNYFYTVVHRLKDRQRIAVNEDGSVWKAPSRN